MPTCSINTVRWFCSYRLPASLHGQNLDERDRENGVISEYQRGTEGGGQDQQPDIPGGGQVQGLRGQQAGRLGGRGPGQSR